MPYQIPQFVRDELAELFPDCHHATLQVSHESRDDLCSSMEHAAEVMFTAAAKLQDLAARLREQP